MLICAKFVIKKKIKAKLILLNKIEMCDVQPCFFIHLATHLWKHLYDKQGTNVAEKFCWYLVHLLWSEKKKLKVYENLREKKFSNFSIATSNISCA